MKIVYLVTATAILLSISTFAFAAAGHDNLRERAAFSKTISGQILGKYAIRKAEALQPQIGAIVSSDFDRALDKAKTGQLSGPFAGVPFLIKDLSQEYKGYPTTCGSRALRNDVATENALVTQRFLDAGLVVFGKTATPELGAKGITESKLWGPCRNPWDTRRTPGGSSGGSASAVAMTSGSAALARISQSTWRIAALASAWLGSAARIAW